MASAPVEDDKDFFNKLHKWWDSKRLKGGAVTIEFAVVDSETGVPARITELLIEKVATEYRCRIENKGKTTARLHHDSSPGAAPFIIPPKNPPRS